MFKLPLQVKCPKCGLVKTLDSKRMSANKFVPELCDGSFGERHKVRQMVGPEGRTDG